MLILLMPARYDAEMRGERCASADAALTRDVRRDAARY